MNSGKNTNRFAWATGLVFALVVITWVITRVAIGFSLDQTAGRGETTLNLTVVGLKGAIGRYRSVPKLVASNTDIQNLLTGKNSLTLVTQVNRTLNQINEEVSASVTYVMDKSGLTLASSNFQDTPSFVGKNYSFRPYFQDAIAGRQGRFFAIGTDTNKRGYFFSSPVRVDGNVVGAVVVKVAIDNIEAAWKGQEHEIIVTDENGIIFMSSKKSWLFHSLAPLSRQAKLRLQKTRKYSKSKLGQLNVGSKKKNDKGREILSVANNSQSVEYLVKSRKIETQGWSVHIFSDTRPARVQAWIITAAVIFVFVSALLLFAIILQRRQRLLDRVKTQQAARQELARQVKLRTADLNQANTLLSEEVAERRATEIELRKTQSDLVQAGKLAALGQMSAALSHEFNQPLAAVKSYADNAVTFFDRERFKDARENITRISSLADRMALISKHLRNFARKPNDKLNPVLVSSVLDNAIELLGRRIKETHTKLVVELPSEDLWVIGGRVRLEQVLVNLINNGLDSMEGMTHSKLEINARINGDEVVIQVRDYGSGLPENDERKVFDPFFTTKEIGKGLGLGLSISYNIVRDFGGRLVAHNHSEGGAVFEIKLKAAGEQLIEAAQ